MTPLNGVLPVDKAAGPTSHDVVAITRRVLGLRRIGHTGTLDPFASGLLLLCLGPATRIAEFLTRLPKSYSATMRLGISTATDDPEGETVRTSDAWRGLTAAAVEGALERQQGSLLQRPPTYSAKKVGGERMYDLARQGREPKPDPVPVTVHRITMIRFDPPLVEFEVDCSSGTYIRSIARDVGEDLGVGAHLVELRRTRVGDHSVASAMTIAALEEPGAAARGLITPAEALRHLPSVQLAADQLRAISHGGRVPAPEGLTSTGPIALLTPEGELAAIGSRFEDRIQPTKVFV